MDTTLVTITPTPLAMPTVDRHDALIAAWLAQVGKRSGSVRTPAEYGTYVRKLQAALAMHGVDLLDVQSAHLQAWAYAPLPPKKTDEKQAPREPSASLVNAKLAAARSFFEFCRRIAKVRLDNPADEVARPKAEPPAPKGLSAPELRALLEALPDTDGGRRDRAIIVTAVMTGLRRAEVLGLTRAQIEDEGGIAYYVTRVKGGKNRRRELPRPALAQIAAYWRARGLALEELPPTERLFPVSGSGFAANLKRYGKKAGLQPKVLHPHALRHSSAKLRREAGESLESVSAHLGHANLSTTSRYLTRLEGERDAGWEGPAAALGLV